jgi:hypothetical protein
MDLRDVFATNLRRLRNAEGLSHAFAIIGLAPSMAFASSDVFKQFEMQAPSRVRTLR